MKKQNHIIYKQILDISFSSRKQALHAQDEISRIYKQDLLPLINEIFDSVLMNDEYIRIDSLEIDLGSVSSANMEEELRGKLKKKLHDELLKTIHRNTPHHKPFGHPLLKLAGELGDEIKMNAASISDLELLIHFIKTGCLPWWTRKSSFVSFSGLMMELLKNQPEALKSLFEDMFVNENYRKRVGHHLSDNELVKIFKLYGPKWGQAIRDINEVFLAVQKKGELMPVSNDNFRLMLWNAALKLLTTQNAHIHLKDSKTYITYLIKTLVHVKKTMALKESDHDFMQQFNAVLQEVSHNGLVTEVSLIKEVIQQYFISLNPFANKNIEEKSKAEEGILTAEQKKAEQKKSKEKATHESVSELDDLVGIGRKQEPKHWQFHDQAVGVDNFNDIDNAGMVILWPYLVPFFEGLGLADKKVFVTNDAAQRAALLLQYLTTGETCYEEYSLILNKLLCGLPIDEPIPVTLNLTKTEIEECDNLLEVVIANWKALKSTSKEGMRQTFLNKNGILTQEMNGWKLKVERSSVDVLVDRLPWTISMIKLPWCDYMISVEW